MFPGLAGGHRDKARCQSWERAFFACGPLTNSGAAPIEEISVKISGPLVSKESGRDEPRARLEAEGDPKWPAVRVCSYLQELLPH